MAPAELALLEFADVPAFEARLGSQPEGAAGAWIRFAKGAGRAKTLSKSDAIDCALCHGWIDGQLGRVDERSHKVRFTPRRAGRAWSQVNRERVERLIVAGRMSPRGLAEVERAKATSCGGKGRRGGSSMWRSASRPDSTRRNGAAAPRLTSTCCPPTC